MFVNLIAPVNQLGYGVVGFNVLKHLMLKGHNVSLWPVGGQIAWESNQEDIDMIKKALNNATFFDPDAPSIRIWHQHDMAMFPGGGTRIGMPIFELDSFTDKEHHHLSSVDRLFVCSQWAKDVCVKAGIEVDRIDVVPLGVDMTQFYVDAEAAAQRPYWNRDSTVFINVGKWEVRKGHDLLLEAFCKAFSPTDNVELWMMNHNPFIELENEAWKTRYIASPMGGRIKMLPRVETRAQLRRLFNQVDFGVFPSHAEGWNLEPLELMACGVPSIVTDYSGHTEFCNETNSILLPTTGMVEARDGRWFHGEGKWASYDVDVLAAKMREAHQMKQDPVRIDRRLIAEGALVTAEKFSWENTVDKMLETL